MIDRIFVSCLALAGLLTPGLIPPAPGPGSAPQGRAGAAQAIRQIGIGDLVEVSDAFHPDELSASERVASDGTVHLPELGGVPVAGLTLEELRARLTERYGALYERVDLEVRVVPRRKHYYLLGEVAEQGQREFEGELTIWEAVLQGRPDLSSANLGRVRLLRPDPIDPLVVTIDLARMLETGDTSSNVQLEEADLVFVPPAPPDASSVAELLARAAAGMEAFARGADAEDAEYVRKLIGTLELVSQDYERVAR